MTELLPPTWDDLDLGDSLKGGIGVAGSRAATWACDLRGDEWARTIIATHRVTVSSAPDIDTFLESSGGAVRAIEAWVPGTADVLRLFATKTRPALPKQNAEFQAGYRQELMRRVIATVKSTKQTRWTTG